MESGTLPVKDATARWWILKEKVDDSGSHVSGGHVAALYDDELYEFSAGRPGVARLQSFGVIFGYSRVVIYIEPLQNRNGDLTANTARTHLLIQGQPLPWTEWAAEFRDHMPEPIIKLMDQVSAGSANSENAASIRERLKQIQDLFKFSRYRPTPGGKNTQLKMKPRTLAAKNLKVDLRIAAHVKARTENMEADVPATSMRYSPMLAIRRPRKWADFSIRRLNGFPLKTGRGPVIFLRTAPQSTCPRRIPSKPTPISVSSQIWSPAGASFIRTFRRGAGYPDQL